MPLGINTAGDIASFVNTIWEDAHLVARDNIFLTELVRNFTDRSGTAARVRSEYGTVTFNQISDADDLASQQFQPVAGNTLTPYEFGAQFMLTDARLETDPFSVRQEAANELGAAAAQKVQRDLTAQFASLTAGTVGSAGGTVTWQNIFAALSLLRQQNAPQPYFIVLQPGHWYYLGTVAAISGMNNNAPEFQNEVMRRFWVGSVGGAQIFVTNDIPSGTAASGAAFSRDAIAFDLRRALRIEPERNASRRAYELNASMLYAAGVWRPKFGVRIIGTSVVA